MASGGSSNQRDRYDGRALVSRKYLRHLLGFSWDDLLRIAESADAHYRPFVHVQERHGRQKARRIDNPTGSVREAQDRLQRSVLRWVRTPDWVLGGVRGKSVSQNGAMHARQPEVVSLDVREFFPSIRPARVRAALRHHLGASREIADLLTRLTTYDERVPQGASTSTTLANLVLLDVLRDTQIRLRRSGITLSTWVDDIVLSGRGARSAISEVIGVLSASGFHLAREKLRIMPSCVPQVVTGTFVNRGVSNGRKRVAIIRAVAHRVGLGESESAARVRGMLAHADGVRPGQTRQAKLLLMR